MFKPFIWILAVCSVSITAKAQDEPEPFNPTDEIIGEVAYIGKKSIGKTKGERNYVEISIREIARLSTGKRTYHIAIDVSGSNLNQQINSKYLTIDEAERLKNAFLALERLDENNGEFKGEYAFYIFSDDLKIAKYFKLPHLNQSVGIVEMGSSPKKVSSMLNLDQFHTIDSLLTRAIEVRKEMEDLE